LLVVIIPQKRRDGGVYFKKLNHGQHGRSRKGFFYLRVFSVFPRYFFWNAKSCKILLYKL